MRLTPPESDDPLMATGMDEKVDIGSHCGSPVGLLGTAIWSVGFSRAWVRVALRTSTDLISTKPLSTGNC